MQDKLATSQSENVSFSLLETRIKYLYQETILMALILFKPSLHAVRNSKTIYFLGNDCTFPFILIRKSKRYEVIEYNERGDQWIHA